MNGSDGLELMFGWRQVTWAFSDGSVGSMMLHFLHRKKWRQSLLLNWCLILSHHFWNNKSKKCTKTTQWKAERCKFNLSELRKRDPSHPVTARDCHLISLLVPRAVRSFSTNTASTSRAIPTFNYSESWLLFSDTPITHDPNLFARNRSSTSELATEHPKLATYSGPLQDDFTKLFMRKTKQRAE